MARVDRHEASVRGFGFATFVIIITLIVVLGYRSWERTEKTQHRLQRCEQQLEVQPAQATKYHFIRTKNYDSN